MIKKIFILFFTFLLILNLNSFCYGASYPKLVTKIFDAFETIQIWLLKISTPAAAVAVATGVFMKKFSFGDEERFRLGKKVIRGSLFSYAFLLCINLL